MTMTQRHAGEEFRARIPQERTGVAEGHQQQPSKDTMNAIILDTETTGLDAPEVIQLAYMGPLATPMSESEIRSQLYQPSKPIGLGAMATHHIIDADVADAQPWTGHWALPAELGPVQFLVGHNVDFDWQAIGSPIIDRICTLALSRRTFPSLDSHTLGAMIYHLYPPSMARQMVRGAHDAATDVELTSRVLFALVDALRPKDWQELWQLSEQARVPTHMPFGKHRGMPVKQLPRDYVDWLRRQPDIDPYLLKAFER